MISEVRQEDFYRAIQYIHTYIRRIRNRKALSKAKCQSSGLLQMAEAEAKQSAIGERKDIRMDQDLV